MTYCQGMIGRPQWPNIIPSRRGVTSGVNLFLARVISVRVDENAGQRGETRARMRASLGRKFWLRLPAQILLLSKRAIPPPIFSSVVIPYRPMKRNLTSIYHLDIFRIEFEKLFVCKEFLNFFLPTISSGIIFISAFNIQETYDKETILKR